MSEGSVWEREVRPCLDCGKDVRFWRNMRCDECLAKRGKRPKISPRIRRRQDNQKKHQEARALAEALRASIWMLEKTFPQQFGKLRTGSQISSKKW